MHNPTALVCTSRVALNIEKYDLIIQRRGVFVKIKNDISPMLCTSSVEMSPPVSHTVPLSYHSMFSSGGPLFKDAYLVSSLKNFFWAP